MSSSEFRNLLEQGDVDGLRSYWARLRPGFPQLQAREDAEVAMHRARTEAITISFTSRAYSHKWLTERHLASSLPDDLKPKAERLYPTVTESVGLQVGYSAKWMQPAADMVMGAMTDAIEDCYAEGDTAPEIVRPRMFEAKDREQKVLFGKFELALTHKD